MEPFVRWTQNEHYKLYDTIPGAEGRFIKLEKCKPDAAPLPDASLTPEEKLVKAEIKKYSSIIATSKMDCSVSKA